MDDIKDKTRETDTTDGTVRPNLVFPENLWKEVKKAAIDKGVSQSQFVIDAVEDFLGLKAA